MSLPSVGNIGTLSVPEERVAIITGSGTPAQKIEALIATIGDRFRAATAPPPPPAIGTTTTVSVGKDRARRTLISRRVMEVVDGRPVERPEQVRLRAAD